MLLNECTLYPSHSPFPGGMEKRGACQINPSSPEVSWMFSGWRVGMLKKACNDQMRNPSRIHYYLHTFVWKTNEDPRRVWVWDLRAWYEVKLKAKSRDTPLGSATFQGNSVNAHWPQGCEISAAHHLLVNPEFTARKFTGTIFIAYLNPYSLSSLMLGSVRTSSWLCSMEQSETNRDKQDVLPSIWP